MLSVRAQGRQFRKARVRRKIRGNASRPRMSIFKSCKHLYAQLINDASGATLASIATTGKTFNSPDGKTCSLAAAKAIGEQIASRALEKGISTVIFDRNGYTYSGKVAAIADAAREKGLKF